MWNYPDYNRTLIDKWKMLTMAQISTLEKERCQLIIRKKAYFEKNQINPALLNKLDHLPAALQYFNGQLEKYDRMIYNMHCEMNWIRELEDGCPRLGLDPRAWRHHLAAAAQTGRFL